MAKPHLKGNSAQGSVSNSKARASIPLTTVQIKLLPLLKRSRRSPPRPAAAAAANPLVCPALVRSDLLSTWLNKPVPIELLNQVETSGGDPQLLRTYTNNNFSPLLAKARLFKDLILLARYADQEQWKNPETIESLKEFLKPLSGDDAPQMIKFLSELGILDSFTAELSNKYSSWVLDAKPPNLDALVALMDAHIPMSKKTRKRLFEKLIKYDLLHIAKQVKEAQVLPEG